jgi:hypothetical protein
MRRSNPKGKGKGSATPRSYRYEGPEDDRHSPRGYRIDDMEEDYDDDPREERRRDRGGDRRGARRDDLREDDWDDPMEARGDDNRSLARDDNRNLARHEPQDDSREIVGERWITQYLPSDGIEWEVIAGDIQIYLGPETSVSMVADPNVRHIVTDESQSY